MLRTEFVEAYDRDRTDYVQAHGSDEVLLAWDSASNVFGAVLYDALSSGEQQFFNKAWIEDYGDYASKLFRKLSDMAMEIETEKDAKLFQHLGFHALTYAMSEAWYDLGAAAVDPKSNEGRKRTDELRASQDYLSLLAGGIYIRRTNLIAKDPGFFDLSVPNFRRIAIEGFLHEVDTAILGLTYAIKHPGVSIVPGPLQFERLASTKNGNANCDFVVLDTSQETATGLQVKAIVRESDLQTYDLSRLALIDAASDLGSRVHRRVVHKDPSYTDSQGKYHPARVRAEEKSYSWGGAIGATHYTNLRSVGSRATRLLNASSELTMTQSKMKVRAHLGGMRFDPAKAYSIVAERIDEKLALCPTKTINQASPTPLSVARNKPQTTARARNNIKKHA